MLRLESEVTTQKSYRKGLFIRNEIQPVTDIQPIIV